MEQEEIIGQLKKHLRLWRTIAWVLTALMICATVALFLLWQKLEKEKHTETASDKRFLHHERGRADRGI